MYPDPWGLAAERTHDKAEHRNGPKRRPLFVTAVSAVVFAVLVALIPLGSGASASGADEPAPTTGPVLVSRGPGVLYGSFNVVGVSSVAVLAEPFSRQANGGRSYTPGGYAVVPLKSHSAEDLSPKLESSDAYVVGAGINGPLVVLTEENGEGQDAAWWYNVSTKKSGLVSLPQSATFEGVIPGGVLFEEYVSDAYELIEQPLPKGKTKVFLKNPDDSYLTVTTGPNGFVGTGIVSGKSEVRYVEYSKPTHSAKVYGTSESDQIYCDTVTTDGAGCVVIKGTKAHVMRIPIVKGADRFSVNAGTAYPYTPWAVVTPNMTSWYTCSITGCPLHRIPVVGKKLGKYPLPIVQGVEPLGNTFYYSPVNNTTSNGGVYSLADTAKKPKQLAPGFKVPYQADAISLGTNTVSWVDNAKSGLGIWTASLSSKGSTVSVGKPKLLGQAGYLDTNSTAYSLNIADPSLTIAALAYAKQPASNPLDVVVYINGHPKVLSDLGDYYYPGEYAPPDLTVSGDYVLWQTVTGWDLGDWKTLKVVSLPMTDIATYALGGSVLAYVKTDGSVWTETTSRSGATRLVPPLSSGQDFNFIDNLSVASDGSHLAFAYGWVSSTTSGQVAQYMSTTAGSTPVNIPPISGAEVARVKISPKVVAVTYALNTGLTSLRGANIKSGTWKTYAKSAYDVSVGGVYAAWIDSTGAPMITKIS